MTDRTHRELRVEEISRIALTYHAWRGEKEAGEYKNIPGFCRSASIEEVRTHDYALVPGRYVGFDRVSQPMWDSSKLKDELSEIETRLADADRASSSAMRVLRDLLDG
jgi:type I restriction enzyme M protein